MTPCPPAVSGRSLLLALGLLVLGQGQAWSAADPDRLRSRALAASCAACHGTDGHAVEGQALARLAGRPKEDTLAQLLAFRTGQRPATVMHQITRGYSPAQLEALATYFAAQK
jgi:cytochrome c553